MHRILGTDGTLHRLHEISRRSMDRKLRLGIGATYANFYRCRWGNQQNGQRVRALHHIHIWVRGASISITFSVSVANKKEQPPPQNPTISEDRGALVSQKIQVGSYLTVKDNRD